MKLIPETTPRRLLLCVCLLTIGYTGFETYQKEVSGKFRVSHGPTVVQPHPTLVADEKANTPVSQRDAAGEPGP